MVQTHQQHYQKGKSNTRFSQTQYSGPQQGPVINSIQNPCPPTARVCLYCVVPHTDLDINKLESLQRRAARWVTCDYQYTFSVSTMLQYLNWRTLDQRRIDSRLALLYKVTCDLVAIPASDYLMRNTCPFSRNHPKAYRQITALKYFYEYTFFPWTVIQWNALPHHIPTLPTLAQFSSAVCQVAHSTNSTLTA